MPVTFDFEIYFFGLICIHGDSAERNSSTLKTRATILADVDHSAVIYVNDDTKVSLQTGVTFANLPPGRATALNSFHDLTPHLARLTRTHVKRKADITGETVIFPDGLLATVNKYPDYKGRYELDTKTIYDGCVGRVTLLQVTTTEPEVIVQFNGVPRYVPSVGWILIGNEDRSVQNNSAKNGETLREDFKKYSKATTGNDDDLADLYERKYDCDTPIMNLPYIKAIHLDEVVAIVRQSPIALHPECSNTQWP